MGLVFEGPTTLLKRQEKYPKGNVTMWVTPKLHSQEQVFLGEGSGCGSCLKEEVRLEVVSLICFTCYGRNRFMRSLLMPRGSGLPGKSQKKSPGMCQVEFWQTADEQAQKVMPRDFPGHPVIRNLPSNAGDLGSIPGQGTKIPHVSRLGPHSTTKSQSSQISNFFFLM